MSHSLHLGQFEEIDLGKYLSKYIAEEKYDKKTPISKYQ